MNKLKTFIVEDERPSLQYIKALLAENCQNEVAVIGEATTILSAYQQITKYNPDLVFMDIRLPDGDAFDLLKRFSSIDFNIIFTTSYDNYATKAFEFNAVHYLLKPLNWEALKSAILRIDKNDFQRYRHLQNYQQNPGNQQNIITIPRSNNRESRHRVKSILYCKAGEEITEIITTDKKPFFASKPISFFDDLLTDYGFFRIHRSYLVNLHTLPSYEFLPKTKLVMANGDELPIARRRRADFIAAYQRIGK